MVIENIINWGYIYPNEIETNWSVLIVLYPYITGLVAGAFIVSSLYHVFGKKEIKPVARFALITALAFLLFASVPLVTHLGHPERNFEIMWTPHLTSAMAGFGYIYTFYMLILLLEIWFAYRADIVKTALNSKGIKQVFYSFLALLNYDLSKEALEADHRIGHKLAIIGIPSACFLHGYVGFIFGGVKANPWWSTPLQPVIFLLSAIVSGIGLLILLYIISTKVRKKSLDLTCLFSLARYLWLFLILDLALESLEIVSMAYENEEAWPIIHSLITENLAFSYIGLQFVIGGIVSFILLSLVLLVKNDRLKIAFTSIASFLVLIQVLAMRWNVVIGGQEISKSLLGLMTYVPPVFHREGIATAAAIMVMPFVALYILVKLLPPWEDEEDGTGIIEEAKPLPLATGKRPEDEEPSPVEV
jgi:Ni/Fe-hydrogenase subunit HybB-like protein